MEQLKEGIAAFEQEGASLFAGNYMDHSIQVPPGGDVHAYGNVVNHPEGINKAKDSKLKSIGNQFPDACTDE